MTRATPMEGQLWPDTKTDTNCIRSDGCICRQTEFIEWGGCPAGPSAEEKAKEKEADDLLGDDDQGDDPAFEEDVATSMRTQLVRETAAERLRRERLRPLSERWFGITGDEFDPDEPEPVPCVLEYSPGRFVFPPGYHSLFGPRTTMKTWLLLFAMLQESRKGNASLFIDYEMSFSGVMRRLHVLGATQQEKSRVVYVRPPGPLTDDGREAMVERFRVLGQGPAVAGIDSQGQGVAAYGLDDNASGGGGVGEFIEAVPMWLKEQWPKAAVIGTDHLPKGADPSKATDPIGSGRKGFAPDGLFSVECLGDKPSRTRRGTMRATVRKARDGFYDEDVALFDYEFGGGGPFEIKAADPAVAGIDLSRASTEGDYALMRRIAEHVGRDHPVLVEACRGALGANNGAFTAAKERLVKLGVLIHPHRAGLSPGPAWAAFMAGAD